MAAFSYTTQTVKFISAWSLFQDCDQASDAFCNSDPDFSWGDNNYSLISKQRFLNALQDLADEEVNGQIEEVIERLKQLPDDIYLNLES